jgi:hypothetical protein
MKKEFVSYEIALALKELGFDEDCVAAYQINYRVGDLTWGGINGFVPYYKEQIIKHNETKWVKVIPAPLYQQAFRFFREKYKLESYIRPASYEEEVRYVFWILNEIKEIFPTERHESVYFKTYEEAQLECLKKLIENVKQ